MCCLSSLCNHGGPRGGDICDRYSTQSGDGVMLIRYYGDVLTQITPEK